MGDGGMAAWRAHPVRRVFQKLYDVSPASSDAAGRVKTLTEGLMEIGVDGGTVDGGDFIFDEEGRVTGWRR
jgi:hypothetical protein